MSETDDRIQALLHLIQNELQISICATNEKTRMLKIMMRWIRPPLFPADEDRTRSAFLLNVILNTFLIALPVLVLAVILGRNIPQTERVLQIVALAWMTIFGTKLIMFSGRVSLAGIVAVIMIFISTTLVVYYLGTIRAPATSFYLLAIVTAGLTISRRAIVWTAGASGIAIVVLLFAENYGYLPRPDLTVSITQATTFVVVFSIISFLLFLAVRSIDESLARVRQELLERRQTEAALQHSTAQLEILHEIDRSLITARPIHDIALDALVRIRQLIPCQRASVTLLDLEKQEASFLAASFHETISFPKTPIPFQQFGQHIIDRLQQNQAWMVDNILDDPQATDLDRKLAVESNIHAWLSLPLLYQGQLIGALNLGRGPGESFDAEDAEIAYDVANQLAMALQQTNLYNALQVELAERKKLISELERNNAELERFTYTVSHDLRNPLVTIKGFVGMLRKDLQDGRSDRTQSDLERIENAADKMHNLLTDLLELSRIGRIHNTPEEIDLNQVVGEAIESLDARLRSKNVTVNATLHLPTIHADRIRVREVFENLIDNAVKYSGEQPDPMIEIGLREDRDGTVFFVKDNGLGIEPQFHARIFGLFDKLNPRSEGNGIGLAIIKRIIETSGGKIWVESEGLGKGSTFCFTIPDERKEPVG